MADRTKIEWADARIPGGESMTMTIEEGAFCQACGEGRLVFEWFTQSLECDTCGSVPSSEPPDPLGHVETPFADNQ